MNRFKLTLVTMFLLASLLACLAIRHTSRQALAQKDVELAVQSEQIAALMKDNARLASPSPVPGFSADAVKAVTAATNEIQKLRALVQSLQEQIATRRQAIAASQVKATPAKPPVHHPEEYWKQLHALAGDRQSDAMKLTAALMHYASDHQGQFPVSWDQATQTIAQDGVSPVVVNEFEPVYAGTFDEVKNLPDQEVPVLRQRQPWPGPDGTTMERIYGFMGGMTMVVESDDNFKSWEATHLIRAADLAGGNP